ncbi:protease modulator HflC [Vibrio parahaemolyticus]|uniref:Protein HflC n=1 Tax=Vibrio parahaemolyticus TaxID=670 RepID=A0AAW8Q802_VIBPH|nr:protease modulator HflC [Vibrio parahaemolyticus]EGR2227734.1 protease modulator HflC [Vibrio parahaemolyticus]MDS1823829.1 protease modulator HflC [Vibrio parahaemolyticus]
MSLRILGKVFATINVALLFIWASAFVVQENETAMVKRFGKVQKNEVGEVVIYKEGLHFKMPIFDSVITTDMRSYSFEIENARFMTNEKKDLIVDGFVTYRVAEPLVYTTSTNGGNRATAERLIRRLFVDEMKSQIGKYQILEVSSGAVAKKIDRAGQNDKQIVTEIEGKRDLIIQSIEDEVKAEVYKSLGIEVVDFRFKSLSLPNEIADSIYNRMRKERNGVANKFRAEGRKTAVEITSDADYQANKTKEEARKDALLIRGTAEALANKIYIDAYSKNIELYEFLKAMDSYGDSLKSKENIIFLSTDMPYFNQLFNKNNLASK